MPADYMTTESRLPFSLEAEQSVLGAALLDAGCVPDLVRLVRPEFFYREQHRKIFEVISGKFTLGEPIDIVTVMEAAVRGGDFLHPGGDQGLLGPVGADGALGAQFGGLHQYPAK